jgi:hypothetical protein
MVGEPTMTTNDQQARTFSFPDPVVTARTLGSHTACPTHPKTT